VRQALLISDDRGAIKKNVRGKQPCAGRSAATDVSPGVPQYPTPGGARKLLDEAGSASCGRRRQNPGASAWHRIKTTAGNPRARQVAQVLQSQFPSGRHRLRIRPSRRASSPTR